MKRLSFFAPLLAAAALWACEPTYGPADAIGVNGPDAGADMYVPPPDAPPPDETADWSGIIPDQYLVWECQCGSPPRDGICRKDEHGQTLFLGHGWTMWMGFPPCSPNVPPKKDGGGK